MFIPAMLFAAILVSCNAGEVLVDESPEIEAMLLVDSSSPLPNVGIPDVSAMERILTNQLISRGVNLDRHTAIAPGAESSVLDLDWIPYDPDGDGPTEQTGFQLSWTDQLVGDYDQNGEVNVSDITPIVIAWNKTVVYELAQYHDGLKGYPNGDPDYDGDVLPGEDPLANSGASNWRLARIDGDSNGEINLAEITPISVHFGERFDGYRIYRKLESDADFVAIEDSQNPGHPLLVSRSSSNNPAGADSSRPVRYLYIDEDVDPLEEWVYYVVPVDTVSGLEGPRSGESNKPVDANLVADVEQGTTPLTVNFDASGSSSLAGSISAYRWDMNGDGLIDEDTGLNPIIQKTFTLSGAWMISVEVTDPAGLTDVASLVVSVTDPPVARLVVQSEHREVPVTHTIDAGTSYDPDGEVIGFEWDMDNDGLYELDTGPVSKRIIEYTETGTYTIGVRVEDNFGAKGETSIQFDLVDEYYEVEDNDTFSQAMAIGEFQSGESTDLVTGGIGPNNYDGDDVDWYTFETTEGLTLEADLEFTHANADLNIELFRKNGTVLWASGTSQSDNELIDKRLPRGETYSLRISRAEGSAGGNALYSLALEFSALTYDELENNDTELDAQDLGDISISPVLEFWGSLGDEGYDGDDNDWYEFSVSQEADYQISLMFFHEDADLELQIFEASSLNLLGTASSVGDGEIVEINLAPGNYLARCYRFSGDHANYQLSVMFDD